MRLAEVNPFPALLTIGPRNRDQLKAGALMFAVLALASFANANGLSERADPWGLVVATSLVAGVAAVIAGVWRLRPTGSLFHIFAFAAVASAPFSAPRGPALLTAGIVIVWAVGVGLSSRVVRSRRVPLREPTTAHIAQLVALPIILWEGAWHVVAAAVAGSIATLVSAGGPTTTTGRWSPPSPRSWGTPPATA